MGRVQWRHFKNLLDGGGGAQLYFSNIKLYFLVTKLFCSAAYCNNVLGL